MPTPRDSQRSKVYRWEQNAVTHDVLITVPHSVDIIRKIWKRYGTSQTPSVKFYRSKMTDDYVGRSFYNTRDHEINLSYNASELVSALSVAHETVHALQGAYKTSGYNRPYSCSEFPKDAWHGPRFVQIAIEVYSWYFNIAKFDLRAWAAKFKVKIASKRDLNFNQEVAHRRTERTAQFHSKVAILGGGYTYDRDKLVQTLRRHVRDGS